MRGERRRGRNGCRNRNWKQDQKNGGGGGGEAGEGGGGGASLRAQRGGGRRRARRSLTVPGSDGGSIFKKCCRRVGTFGRGGAQKKIPRETRQKCCFTPMHLPDKPDVYVGSCEPRNRRGGPEKTKKNPAQQQQQQQHQTCLTTLLSANADIHWPRYLDAGLFAENLSQRGSISRSRSGSSSAIPHPDH